MCAFFDEGHTIDVIRDLLKQLTVQPVERRTVAADAKLLDKTVVFTGELSSMTRDAAKARAEELRARLSGGATTAEALAGTGLEAKPIQPLRRDAAGTDQGINPAVVRALFATAPGAVADQVVEVGDAFAVVATDEVIAADPGGDAAAVSQLERELEAELRADLIAQFEAQLRRDYPVEIDGAAINRLIQAGGAAPAAPSRPLPSALF